MYNAAQTIVRCIDSVLKQMCESVEVICIDDGSTDETIAKIKESFSTAVRVIKSTHKGVSNARNIGIKEANGEYVLFCDADDEYLPNAFDVLEKVCDAEIVFFGAKVIDCDEKYHLNDIEMDETCFEKKPSNFFYAQKNVWPYVWHCAYKTEFLRENRISFSDELALGEDLAFQFEAVMMANNIRCIDSKLYKYYHCRQGSSEMAFLSNPVERVKRHIKIIETCYDSFEKHDKKPNAEFYNFAFEFLYRDIFCFNKNEYKEVKLALCRMNLRICTRPKCENKRMIVKLALLENYNLLCLYTIYIKRARR